MSKKTYIPPEVWKWDQESGGTFSKTNRPIAGATHEKKLPVGKHPLQLYSLATPNGVKITVMLEELLALGFEGAEYDAWLVKIDGNQFGSGFVELNPNSKIPTFADHSSGSPIRIFESGAIMLYLAEKFDALIPKIFDTNIWSDLRADHLLADADVFFSCFTRHNCQLC